MTLKQCLKRMVCCYFCQFHRGQHKGVCIYLYIYTRCPGPHPKSQHPRTISLTEGQAKLLGVAQHLWMAQHHAKSHLLFWIFRTILLVAGCFPLFLWPAGTRLHVPPASFLGCKVPFKYRLCTHHKFWKILSLTHPPSQPSPSPTC